MVLDSRVVQHCSKWSKWWISGRHDKETSQIGRERERGREEGRRERRRERGREEGREGEREREWGAGRGREREGGRVDRSPHLSWMT